MTDKLKTPEELKALVSKILSEKEGLSNEVRDAILDDILGYGEEDPGSADNFLKALKSKDAEYLTKAVRLASDIKVSIVYILTDYADKVR